MKNLVISKYTRFFSTEEKGSLVFLVYNSLTNSFMQISKRLFDLFCHPSNKEGFFPLSKLTEEELEIFIKTKNLVEKGADEDYIRNEIMKSNLENYASTHLSLTIAPTTACNFICPYCYEKSKPNKIMDESVIDSLIHFINEHQSVKTLSIVWYGGEPLLAFPAIENIVNRINTECVAKLTNQEIVTNGYCFNQKVIDFFKTYPLSKIQITIDGPEEIHNKKRMLKNGGETYQQIVSNLQQIVNQLEDTKILIRVNVDKSNQMYFSQLYKELHALFGIRIHLYPGFIKINNEGETALTCDSMMQHDARLFYDSLEKEEKVKIRYYPKLSKNRGCVATCATAYVIGPCGELYKCWNDIGNETMIVGYIFKPELTNLQLYNRYMVDGQWMADEECRECFFFPICSGGCAWQRIKNKFYQGKYDSCSIYKEAGIEKYLALYYKQSIINS